MTRALFRLLLTSLAIAATPWTCDAQQFRVYTRVSALPVDSSAPGAKPEVLLRSLTIFHAGRVFDLLHGMGEVTVFEPAHQRFLVLNFNRRIATTVSLSEVERLLAMAEDDAENFAKRLAERTDPQAAHMLEPLQFQLSPELSEKFDSKNQQLVLSNPRFVYRVAGCTSPEPAATTAYLDYADWAARLNYILHPNRVLPEARLRLNSSLRTHKLLPLKVERCVSFEQTETLEAEHLYTWQLGDQDREYINHWEQAMRGDELEWLTFRDYQWAVYDKKTARTN